MIEQSNYKSGNDLIGHKVSIWKQNSFSKKMFKAFGVVIKYRKQGKGKNLYLVEFSPTKNQKESFKMWHFRGSITQEE